MANQPGSVPGRWITPLLLGAVAGPALQLQQPALWPGAAYAALGGLGLAVLALAARRRSARIRPALALLAAALVAFASCGWRADRFLAGGLDPALEGRDLLVVGVVAALPQQHEAGLRFRFEVESATTAEGVPVRLVPLLSLGWYGGVQPAGSGLLELQRLPADLHPGERWQLAVRVKAPHGTSNPHGFDYELWLWEQGVQATGSVRAGPRDPAPRLLGSGWRHPVERLRQEVRDGVFRQVPDRATAGVLAALVVGDQNAIERADWDVFRATGVAHLMSISGLHITMFAWLAAQVVGALWRRSRRACLAWPAQHAALAGGALLAAGYALFSGWGVPAQRTVLMLATVALLRLSGRHWPWPVVWLLAAAVVVTADPWALLQAGFWLSFVAVGVLFASGSAPAAGALPDRRARLARAAVAALREQWVVTLALTPLTLLLFGQASVVGLAANALAIPWVTLLVTPLAILGAAVPWLWTPAAAAVQVLQQFLQLLAALPFATVTVPAAPLWAGVAGLAGGVLLALRLPWTTRLLGVPLLLPVLLWQSPRPAPGQFELLAADIGQGNAVIVRTAGHTLVYDSGPRYSAESDAGHRVLVPLLRALDERVQLLVLSHRDTDHTGGAAAVLAQQGAASLLSSLAPDHALQTLRGSGRCEAGQAWNWDGVRFEVLHPAAADYAAAGRANTLSCVLRVAGAGSAALLAGDIEQAQEARLAAQAGDGSVALAAQVLLVPHHGSRTSSTSAFLDAVQPRIALLQAGYRNRFGHPAPVVLERYRERGVQVVESARCGAAGWRSEQPDRVTCERERSARFWLHRMP